MTTDETGNVTTLADRCMKLVWRRPAESPGESARRRVTIYLIPYVFFLYILAYLDRVNVSVAALHMEMPPSEGGLGFSKEIIGFGAGIFFWGYWILEVPSTLSVLRWGARYVFVRILVLWGLACMLIGTVGTPLSNTLLGWLPAINLDAGVVTGLDAVVDVLFGWLAHLFGHARAVDVVSGIGGVLQRPAHGAGESVLFLPVHVGLLRRGLLPVGHFVFVALVPCRGSS